MICLGDIKSVTEEFVNELSTQLLRNYVRSANADRAKQLEIKHTADNMFDIQTAKEKLAIRKAGTRKAVNKIDARSEV